MELIQQANLACTGWISYQLVEIEKQAKEETCDLLYQCLLLLVNYPRDGCGAYTCPIFSVLTMMAYKLC